MGAGQSAEVSPCSPLKHWNKFGGDPLTKQKLKEYCTQWWPKSKLEDEDKWPKMVSLNYDAILQLMLFCKRQDKWDEIPYVDLFFTLRNDHGTRKKCKLLMLDSNVLMMMVDMKKPLQCFSACSIGRRCLKLEEEKEDVQMLVVADRESITRGIEGGDRGSKSFSPVTGRTQAQHHPVIQAPLHQAVGPDGSPVYVKVPFSASDLMNLKESARSYWDNPDRNIRFNESARSYWDNPDRMYRYFRMIIENHNPDWQDIQVLLNHLFTPDEKRVLIEKPREENEQLNARDGPERFMPTQEPNWNQNLSTERLMIKQYQQPILYGIKNRISKRKNLAKLYQVIQSKTEVPSAFYKQLFEVA
nr:PREDICTED: natural cytotoxicity triggering receptor 3 ligand 1 [Phalacrocorax carbo]